MDTQGYISSFDATFHALALLKNAIFMTADEKHIRKVQKNQRIIRFNTVFR